MASKDNADALLDALSPKSKDAVQKDDVSNAKKVRETFLSYRKQLAASLKVLDKHSQQNDENAKEMANEVQSLMSVLDKLEKKKKLTSDTLLSFISQMRTVGGKLNSVTDDKTNKTALAEELRKQKQDTLEDDKKQDSRFASLAAKIGQPLDKFIKGNASAIGTGGGSMLKVAMAAWLGPAAPLVKLVDDLVDIEGKVGKLYTTSVDVAKKGLKATISAPTKMIKAGGEWAKTQISVMKARAREEDQVRGKSDKRMIRMMQDQLGNLKDMKKKLGRLGGSMTSAIGTMLMSLGGLVAGAIKGLGGTLMRLMSGFLPKGVVKGAKSLWNGAKKLFKRGGASNAGRSASRFTRAATGGGGKGLMGKAMQYGGTAMKFGGKALGAVGGAYGMYDGYQTVKANKGKDLMDGGMNSRAGGYASAALGGAAVGATIGSIIPGLGTAVGAAVGAAVGGLTAAFADNEDAILGGLAKASKTAKDFGNNLLEKAKGVIVNSGQMLAASPLGVVMGKLTSATVASYDQLKEWGGQMGGWLKDTVKGISDGVTSAVSSAVTKMGDVMSGAFDKMGGWLRDMGLGDLLDSAKDKLSKAKEAVGGAYNSAKDAVGGAYDSAKGFVGNQVNAVQSTVGGWYDQAKSSVVGTAYGAEAKLLNGATSARDAVKGVTGVDLAGVLPAKNRANLRNAKVEANYAGVKDDIQGAAKATGMNPGTMARFASIESSFNPNAKAGVGSAGGLYQFIDGTWDDQLKKHGKKYGLDANTSKFDPKANALMGAELLKENKNKLSKVTGGEVTDTQLYMAHFLGSGGASQFLKEMQRNPSGSAAASMPAAAKANPNIFYEGGEGGRERSFKEVYALMEKKISGTDQIAAKANADAGIVSGTMVASAAPGATAAGSSTPTTTAAGTPVAPTASGSATEVASSDVHYIPKSNVPPTVNADDGSSATASGNPSNGSGSMKSSLSQIPFMPDDQNLIAFNIAGLIG